MSAAPSAAIGRQVRELAARAQTYRAIFVGDPRRHVFKDLRRILRRDHAKAANLVRKLKRAQDAAAGDLLLRIELAEHLTLAVRAEGELRGALIEVRT